MNKNKDNYKNFQIFHFFKWRKKCLSSLFDRQFLLHPNILIMKRREIIYFLSAEPISLYHNLILLRHEICLFFSLFRNITSICLLYSRFFSSAMHTIDYSRIFVKQTSIDCYFIWWYYFHIYEIQSTSLKVFKHHKNKQTINYYLILIDLFYQLNNDW